ncbi:MAG: sugar phosphate isomerase/epimerase family protein [Sciscionella sp.]
MTTTPTAPVDTAGFEFVASYWTIAGDARLRMFGGTDYSPIDLRQRIETAAATGYAGVGFHSADLLHWADRHPPTEVTRILAGNGLGIVELEILREWFVTGEPRAESDAVRQQLLRLCEELPVTHLKVGSSFGPEHFPAEHIATEFAALCLQFADVGTRVGLEAIPNAHLRTPAEVLEVVELADPPNGGLILDTWHGFRGHVPYPSLRDIPAARIVSVEVADGAAEPVVDLANDGCNHRQLIGEGAFGTRDWLAAILETGYAGHIGVENLSEENRRRPLPAEAYDNLAAAAREFAPLSGRMGANRSGR